MAKEKVDLDAALWLMDNGTTLSIETVRAIINELSEYRNIYRDLCENGCGNRECGMTVWQDSIDEK